MKKESIKSTRISILKQSQVEKGVLMATQPLNNIGKLFQKSKPFRVSEEEF